MDVDGQQRGLESSQPQSVLKLSIFCEASLLDALSAHLFEIGASGLEELPSGFVIYPENEIRLGEFQSELRDFELKSETKLEFLVERIPLTWNQTWQDALSAEQLTPRLMFRPTHDSPAPADEETLWFKPQTSFGSGGHPTTRLAASFIENFMEEHPGSSMFDVGCGSGVLTLVAKLRGAGSLLAVDIDPVSVNAALLNLQLNHLSEDVRLQEGSADASEALFDLVVANVNTPILRELSPQLRRRIKPTGTLLLTGLLDEDRSELQTLYEALGLNLQSQRNLEGWSLLEWKC